MTPEQTLRAAAQKVREHAAAALPADHRLAQPWHTKTCADEYEDTDGCPCFVTYAEHDDGSGAGVSIRYVAEAETTGYAAWIALMHPGVGLALADWLDGAAARERANEAAAARVYTTPADQAAWLDDHRDHQALAVARQILGDQP